MSTWTEFSDSVPDNLYFMNTEEPKMNKYEITYINNDGCKEAATIEAYGINLSEGVLVVVNQEGHAKAFFRNWSHVQEV